MPGTVELTWLGQSGFLLRFPSANVLVDPFLSDRGERLVPAPALESLGSIDILAATHEHWDHLDLPAIVRLARAAPSGCSCWSRSPSSTRCSTRASPRNGFAACNRTRSSFIATCGSPQCRRDTACTSPTPTTSARELSDGKVRYLGYVLSEEGVVVYHAGDTILYDEHASRLESLGVQLALLPINGRDPEREALDLVGNLSPDEAASLIAEAQHFRGRADALRHVRRQSRRSGALGLPCARPAVLVPALGAPLSPPTRRSQSRLACTHRARVCRPVLARCAADSGATLIRSIGQRQSDEPVVLSP